GLAGERRVEAGRRVPRLREPGLRAGDRARQLPPGELQGPGMTGGLRRSGREPSRRLRQRWQCRFILNESCQLGRPAAAGLRAHGCPPANAPDELGVIANLRLPLAVISLEHSPRPVTPLPLAVISLEHSPRPVTPLPLAVISIRPGARP